MKRLFTLLLLIVSFNAFSQQSSTINFVNHKYSPNMTVYLNEQMAGTFGKDENLQYKLYSKGRITITMIVGVGRLNKFVDVEPGKNYYFLLKSGAYGMLKFDLVSEKEGKEYFDENKNTVKAEENKNNPLVKDAASEDDGPKQGTCFLVSKKGYMITNYHVISGAKTVQVKGIGGDYSTLYGVDVVSVDVMNDLALLKLKNQTVVFDELPYNISKIVNQQGTKAFVLGYPMANSMGEEIKLTDGLISSKSGYKGSISLYQFSAPVQPGNSGSPLFNEDGEVIGIINAKVQEAEGVGYAIKSPFLLTFLSVVDNFDLPQNTTSIKSMSLADKTTLLKKNIFIVKTE